MQTAVYVDVLLVLNYVVTALLLLCTGALLGVKIKRRRMVAASLLGALGSLTIFLPFLGFWPMLAARLGLSGAMMLVALPWRGLLPLLGGWFVFFAVNFFFAGVMLAVWMVFTPSGMLYYNGVVYFNVNPLSLLLCTAAAYLLLTLAGRASRGGRLRTLRCRAVLKLGGRSCTLEALLDTGNSLSEPFSGLPVIICRLDAVRLLLGFELHGALARGNLEEAARLAGSRVRMVPYAGLGYKGALPALRGDELIVNRDGQLYKSELFYVALTDQTLHEDCDALLHPDLASVKMAEKTPAAV